MNSALRQIFKQSVTFSAESFKLFRLPLRTFLGYFFLLNLIMFIPLTYSIFQLDSSIQTLLGIQLTDADGLSPLPETCEIVNEELICEPDTMHYATFSVNDQPIQVIINAPVNQTAEPFQLVMHPQTTELRLAESSLMMDYRGFGYTPFSDLNESDAETVYTTLFDGFYPSLRPFLALPMTLIFVGGYILTNVILLFTLAGFAMLFKLTIYDLPTYRNMVKLFVLASTIPGLINLAIGLFGLSAFSSLVYNFLTPFFVYVLYRRKDPELMASPKAS